MATLLAASAFDPSGNHYASVVTSLDTHKIRIQSTNPTSSLANAFSLDKGNKLTSVSWALSPDVDNKKSPSKKKRRRSSLAQQQFILENQIISIGLNKGSILQYSPSINQVVGKLENPNASSINDYQFSTITNSGWSVDVSQNIIEWDLILFKPKNQFKFKESINLIRIIEYQDKPHLLLASHSVFLVDIETQEIVKTFPGHISPIHTLLPLDDGNSFITAASGDRFVNIYSLDGTPSVLVTQSDVVNINYNHGIVTATTEDGFLEVFNDILNKSEQTPSKSNKRKVQQSKQSSYRIDLKRPNSDSIRIEDSFISADFITITWLESSNIPYFEKIKINELTSNTVITKDIPKTISKNHSAFGKDLAAPQRYNENSAIVSTGDNLQNLDNKEINEDNEVEADDEEEDGPSLAEKMELLKVENTLPKKKSGKATTGSLVVILTQALRSSDHSLLDTVLNNRNENVLKTTIERLDTSLAVILLERLAERIARNTNRQGQLNIWVKWVMIIHGGYLINIPNLSKSLSSLHSTLIKRSKTLPRLLELQGRLDVLYSQLESNKANKELQEEEYNDSEDSDVEYIEELDGETLIGDEDDDDDDDDDDNDDEGIISRDEEEFMELDSDDEAGIVDVLEDHEMDIDVGFSDEEVNGNGIEESESEDELKNLQQRILKLKAKQDKRKSN